MSALVLHVVTSNNGREDRPSPPYLMALLRQVEGVSLIAGLRVPGLTRPQDDELKITIWAGFSEDGEDNAVIEMATIRQAILDEYPGAQVTVVSGLPQ